MNRKFDYLHTIFWFLAITVPHVLQQLGILDTNSLKTHPSNGPLSILTGVFMHGNWAHMAGNLSGMLVGTAALKNIFGNMYWKVVALGILLPSVFVYLKGMPTVGISGLVYAVVWCVIVAGIMSKDRFKFLVGVVFALFYGVSLKGAVPQPEIPRMAWEAHLVGLVVGSCVAIYHKIRNPRC